VTRFFVTDCEGPVTKNDNAFELMAHFVPNGGRVFAVLSKYDDVLADVLKMPGYSAGNTLKLILPFLKAYGVTDKKMEEFSAKSMLLIADCKTCLQHVRHISEAFIVSTSYEHYVRALCRLVEFPYENTYCTRLSMDKYGLTEHESSELRKVASEIARMPIVKIPPGAKRLEDFSLEDQQVIERLNEIFWEEVESMCGRMMAEVKLVGGAQKAEAVTDAADKAGADLCGVMYVGDSITDVEALRRVKAHNGLAVSFNGNGYAVDNAEIAVLSESSLVTAVIFDVFCKYGKQKVLELSSNWSHETLVSNHVDPLLLSRLFEVYPAKLPKVQRITSENRKQLSFESSEFRKHVRGEAVGELG